MKEIKRRTTKWSQQQISEKLYPDNVKALKRRDLEPPSNLKKTFQNIRNHLAGMAKGITRDETLAQEIINLLFCKIYDEISTRPDEELEFQANNFESSGKI